MKKIININLSGRVVPIEDTAYEKLQDYIESLRKYFAKEEGREEIINDIESRIAELMSDKIRLGASSVTEVDVDQIIASMGRPEDFEASVTDDDSFSYTRKAAATAAPREKRKRGRLYRDTSDKFLGGVCSGIANYLNIDPAIVRILFAIITFGGFGLGVLAYILLWLILPGRDLDDYEGKRLYRNPDDRIIGGVASGLAAYFNRSASTIRVIFAIPMVLNILFGILNGIFFNWDGDFFAVPNIFFGSFTGTFILAYVILWMVLPEAKSTYDKMEMRGEKVDVNTIRQNVQEGIDSMKGRAKTFAAEAGDLARRGGSGLGHAIGVIFKVFFLFIAGSIAFGLFVAMIALIFGGIAWWPANNFLWTSNSQQMLAWGTLIFFFLVPLIAFITWVVRRILRVRSRHNYLGWTFAGLWTIGWICAALFATSIARDLREYEHTDMTLSVTQPTNNRMLVRVSEPRLEYTGNFGWMDNDAEGWDLSQDTLKLSIVRFDIQKSMDSNYHVTIKKYSAGRTRLEAMERADQILFNASYRDSILDLGSGYAISKESKFRGQKVEIEIQVPEGKKINFHETVKARINPANIRVYRKEGWRRRGVDIHIDDEEQFPWKSNVDYVMGSDGELKDTEGNVVNEQYRYKDPVQQTDSIETREQKKKRLEEELKKLNAEERKTSLKISTQAKEDGLAGSPSVMFSMTEMWN